MTRLLFSLFFLAMTPSLAVAQASPTGISRDGAEVAFEYTYLRSNAPPAQCDCFSLNGGGLSVAQPWGSGHLAAVFDASVAHGSRISSGSYDLTLSSFTEVSATGRFRGRAGAPSGKSWLEWRRPAARLLKATPQRRTILPSTSPALSAEVSTTVCAHDGPFAWSKPTISSRLTGTV